MRWLIVMEQSGKTYYKNWLFFWVTRVEKIIYKVNDAREISILITILTLKIDSRETRSF